jgi:hypothetical protein
MPWYWNYLGDPIEVAGSECRTWCGPDLPYRDRSNEYWPFTLPPAWSLIKTLSLHHGKIAQPESICQTCATDFAGSRFAVADRLLDWPEADGPRRAAVNSLGWRRTRMSF